jgi:HSP20 family protein
MTTQNVPQQKSERVNGKTDAVLPRADVYENATELLVVFDVPGAVKDQVDVRVEQNELVVDARRADGIAFQRTFKLPDGIDNAEVAASLDGGILRVRLPKAAQKRARRIEIKSH